MKKVKKRTLKKQLVKETRDIRITFTKSGTGYRKAVVFIPVAWLDHMGINEEDRTTEMTYSPRTKKINIKKKSSETSTDNDE